ESVGKRRRAVELDDLRSGPDRTWAGVAVGTVARHQAQPHAVLLDGAEGCHRGAGIGRPDMAVGLGARPELEAGPLRLAVRRVVVAGMGWGAQAGRRDERRACTPDQPSPTTPSATHNTNR